MEEDGRSFDEEQQSIFIVNTDKLMEIEGRGELKFPPLDAIWKSKYEPHNGGETLNQFLEEL